MKIKILRYEVWIILSKHQASLYLYVKFTALASIIIQSDNSDNLDLIAKLAKKLGVQVNDISDELSEDLALGKLMTKSKTGTSVSRETIMKKLQS